MVSWAKREHFSIDDEIREGFSLGKMCTRLSMENTL